MASNRLPTIVDALFVRAEEMAEGLKLHESSVGVLHNTEAKIRAELAAMRDANSAALAASTLAKACATAQNAADAEATAFIGSCKRVLLHYLGTSWSPEWAAAGFPGHSIAIPKLFAERQTLAGALRDYLAAHPAHEDGPLAVTAERGAQVFDALGIQRAAANDSYSTAGQANAAFEAAHQALRSRMSGLVFELRQLLGPGDPRWYAFGLKRPADPDRPGIPKDLTLIAGQPGVLYASWTAAPRAARYRVYVKETGDAEFRFSVSTWEANATVEVAAFQQTGASVWVQVTAVNDAGESRACKPAGMPVAPGEALAGMAA